MPKKAAAAQEAPGPAQRSRASFLQSVAKTQSRYESARMAGMDAVPLDPGVYNVEIISMSEKALVPKDPPDAHWALDWTLRVLDGEHEGVEFPGPFLNDRQAFSKKRKEWFSSGLGQVKRLAFLIAGEEVNDIEEAIQLILDNWEGVMLEVEIVKREGSDYKNINLRDRIEVTTEGEEADGDEPADDGPEEE
jgi:hypothetical protein